MSENVGGIDFTVGLDGKKLPAEAAAQGRIAGEAMGHEFKQGFEDGSRGINIDNVENLFLRLSPNATKQLRKVNTEIDNSTVHMNRFKKSVQDAGSNKLWNSIPQNGRQVVFWVTAAVSAASELANLGAAAGGGLAIIGAGLADVAVAGGVAYAAFSELNKGVDKVPAVLKPAAKAFADLKAEMQTLRADIATAAFKDSAGTFQSLTGTVKALSPALQSVGKVLGDVVGQFAKGIAPGTKAFADLQTIITNSGPILQKMATAAGKLGSALLSALANKSVNKAVGDLADAIGRAGDSIQKFIDNGGLDDWMKNTESVFKHLTPLFKDAAKAIGSLITPANVKSLNTFLDSLDKFVSTTAGPLLQTASKLNIFGLIADALNAIGRAIGPLIKPLGDLFDGLHRVVSIAIGEWGKDFEGVAKALAPLVTNLGDFFKTLDPQVIKDTADALAIFAGVIVGQKLVDLVAGLTTKVVGLGGAFSGLEGPAKTAGAAVKTGLGSALNGAAAGYIVSQFADQLTSGFSSMKIGKIDFKPAAQGAVDQWSGALAGAAAGAKYGGPVGAMVGGFAGALASVDWGVVTSVLTDPNYKGTKAIEDGFKQGPFFGLVEMIKTDPDIPKKTGEALGKALSHMWDFVGDVLAAPYKWVNDHIIAPIQQALSPENFGKLFNGPIAGLITGPLAGINQWIQDNVVTPINNFFNNPLGGLQDVWTNIVLPWLTTTFGPAWQWVQDNVVTPINNFANNPLGGLQDVWTNVVLPWVNTTFGPAWTWVQDNVVTPIQDFANNPFGGIADAWSTVSTWVGNTFGPAWKWVSDNIVSPIHDFASNPLGGISSAWGALSNWVSNTFGPVVSWFQRNVINPIRNFLSNPLGGLGSSLGSLLGGGHASGALVMAPERALIGEAGPEMVVPLARPLNQVDPAVRQVAAFAQGKTTGTGGGGTSIGKQVNVEAGAIVVAGVSDPQLASTTVLDDAVRKF